VACVAASPQPHQTPSYYVAHVIACTWPKCTWLNSGLARNLVFIFISRLLSPLCTWGSSFSWESHSYYFYYMNKSPCSSRLSKGCLCGCTHPYHLKFYLFRRVILYSMYCCDKRRLLYCRRWRAPQGQITGLAVIRTKSHVISGRTHDKVL